MIKRPVLTALMATATFFMGNASASAETLQQSISQALAAHPSVEAALAGKVVAKEDYKESRSGFFPTLAANLTGGRIFGDNSTSRGLSVSRGTAYSNLGEGSASLTQPFFDGMETANRTDAASARLESANYNVVDVRENLALRAAQVHLSLMQTQATLNKTRSYYDVIEDYLSRIQLMVDEGVADETEVAQARNISLMLKSNVTDFEGQLNAAYAGYKEIIGHLPKSPLVKPADASPLIKSDVDTAISHAKVNHPLVKAGLKELEAAGYDVKAEYGGFYPSVDGELSYLKRDQVEEIGGEVTDARAVVKMSWDFETGGAQIARTRKTRAQYSELQAQNRETIRTIEGDIRRSYAEYETAKQQLELVKEREKVTSDLLEAYKNQFEGAVVRLLQLMQAENQLFNAQLESATAEYRFLLAQYAVLASMGQLLNSVDKLPHSSVTQVSTPISADIKVSAPPIVEAAVVTAQATQPVMGTKEPIAIQVNTEVEAVEEQKVKEVSKRIFVPEGAPPEPKDNGRISTVK